MERIPCDPEQRGTDNCAVYRRIGRCFMDVHHLYHPSRDYTTSVEREFRQLDENKVRICRAEHNEAHTAEPPTKPCRELMLLAIEENINKKVA